MKTRFVFLLFFAAAAVFSNTVFKSDYTKNLSVFRPIGGIEPKLENGKLFLEKGTQLSIRVPAPGRYKINAKISGISRSTFRRQAIKSAAFALPMEVKVCCTDSWIPNSPSTAV